MFSACFQWGFGVALHQLGLISSVLDTWHPHCATLTSEQGHPRSESGWAGTLEVA